MFQGLSLPVLLGLFAGAAAAVWYAGIRLSDTTDILASRLGLGEALGGLILLAFATNLPEIAITASAAWSGDLGIAIGNILGGIAIQTVVLVVLDAFGVRGPTPLTYRAASLVLVLEGTLVIAVLIVAIMASRLPPSLVLWRVAPGGALIAVLWAGGLWLIGRARHGLPWHEGGDAPDSQAKAHGGSRTDKDHAAQQRGESTTRAVLVFSAAAVVTLAAGVVLEDAGDGVAKHVGMSGVLFGATALAAATSLPEISTGLASVKLEDYQLAVSDIFGGNAFLPVLFLVATLISGKAALPQAQNTDIYLAGLGILLTTVYVYGLIFRPKRRILRMGPDSLAVLVLYALGVAGLVFVAQGAPHS
jgi:cation:H+ antiporter